jgi:hypothetical protein
LAAIVRLPAVTLQCWSRVVGCDATVTLYDVPDASAVGNAKVVGPAGTAGIALPSLSTNPAADPAERFPLAV